MHITLRPNEKIYINGAVLRVDRKVSVELMNDAVFLLEAHVMLEQNATTPLRRLYFIVQLMLIEPHDLETKRARFHLQGLGVAAAYDDPTIQLGLASVATLVGRGRPFEALKLIRSMLAVEDGLIGAVRPAAARGVDVAVVHDETAMPRPAGPQGPALARRAAVGS